MYDRTVNGQVLTFCVSGKLWNRSLVMLDLETRSLWSHLLGQAMEGPLKGQELHAIPADMVTWSRWREKHPDTTVLNLPRTSVHYTREFYRQRGAERAFVVGFEGSDGMYHCNFETLRHHPTLNVQAGSWPLLLSFDAASTSVRIFDRRIDDRVLTFAADGDGTLRDEQTGSLWDRDEGEAVSGPMQGRTLKPQVAIVSLTRAWQTFHPDSREVRGEDR